MPKTEDDSLREQLLALMVAPIPDYSVDSGVTDRVGKLLAQQADDRANLWRLRK